MMLTAENYFLDPNLLVILPILRIGAPLDIVRMPSEMVVPKKLSNACVKKMEASNA